MFLAPVLPSPLAGLKEPPSRMRIAKWGLNESRNGNFTVGPKTAKFLPTLQKLLGFDTIALDFEHNTVKGTEAYNADKEPRNVAAHCPLSVVPGEGIFAENIQWTPHGVKSVTEGLHPDMSPTIKTDDAGEVVFIHSAGLCRQGAVLDLKVFSAADLLNTAQLATFSATVNQPATNPIMDYKKILCLILGLDPATATDADIETAAKKFASSEQSTAETMQTNAAKLDALTKTVEALAEAVKNGKVETHAATAIQSLETKLGELQKQQAAAERTALINQAIGLGKIVPHGAAIDALDNAAFKALLDTLQPDQVPLTQRTPEGLKTFSVTSAADDTAEKIRKAAGIKQEDWDKYAKA